MSYAELPVPNCLCRTPTRQGPAQRNIAMSALRQTKPRNPAHAHVQVKREVEDNGTTYYVYSCKYCDACQQKLKQNGSRKPSVKINRFVEHFALQCEGCPSDVKTECLKKCKSQMSQLIKAEREAKEKLSNIPIASSSKIQYFVL